jgi:hypothetical protein
MYKGGGGIRQADIQTAEPFVSEPSISVVGDFKSCKSPGADQIPAELIQGGGGRGTLQSEIHKLTKLIWNKELPNHWKESIVVPIQKRMIKLQQLLGCIIAANFILHFIQHSCLKVKSFCR